MHVQQIVPNSSGPALWDKGEMPPGPPMPLDSSWVKGLQILFPTENPEHLSKYAGQLLSNMMRTIQLEIARNTKKAHETARKMKEAILGRY
jgi:hypothetical protein